LGLATCAAILCAFIAPAAAGSGIPEVKAYLNGVDAHSILAPSTLFVKVGLSLSPVMFPYLNAHMGDWASLSNRCRDFDLTCHSSNINA